MADIILCEPIELFNLLNQRRRVPRLAEINYLCLVDAQEIQDYYTGHIITARNVRMEADGSCYLPDAVEVGSMRHIVVYDSVTSCLQEEGRAADCAQSLAKSSFCPVQILKGGYRRFSALYPFLRTEKIQYTITELENLKMYPVEIIVGLLYMGDQNQSQDANTLKDLKISATVSISHFTQSDSVESGTQTILNIPVADEVESDLYSNFQTICGFISSHTNVGSRVLIVSRQGRSRCSAVAIAFLMHHYKYTLEEAWWQMMKCKPTMRPNTGFLQQLSDWELHTLGRKHTDLSKAPF
ncbi:serine/threonine/tyrosine-interacting-like protein 1 isoform X1 [Fundulus heteroclitus]|uniref:serine/threonine/tyrosine-interacting-like protein 1 isoform X1 n=2 Tax=Fundulus heteroclitus TaxID=8078 RepID=UPI00165B815D|nr:serine/threonine/tyrosine-interacting-like protein 1 isoform X1 [Fundulus heteroclitus]